MNPVIESAVTDLPLGILDLSKLSDGTPGDALAGTIALAQAAEKAGYGRFWVAEHHVQGASHSCPEILAAVIAARTSTIRVGAAGVLLRYYSPLKVAETFLALEALFPGRIDLGVAKGPGVTDASVAEALVYGNVWELEAHSFDRKVLDLVEVLALPSQGDRGHAGRVVARPEKVLPPPMWLLGSGPSSAVLAARIGVPCAIAAFTRTPEEASRQLESYRRAAGPDRRPTALAVSVTVADSVAAASAREDELVAASYLPANFTGTPATVARQLHELRARSGVDEIVLTTFATGITERHDMFTSIADSFRAHGPIGGLPPEASELTSSPLAEALD
nr:MsnO8 family LLM class oxidoreductase [Streptomyces sp. NBC_00899]